MAVTMQEQPTWSGDWKVMIVDTLSCWATMELTHWRNGVYQLNTGTQAIGMDFATFEQALRVADYLQLELGKDYLVFPLLCKYSTIVDGAFTGHGLLVLNWHGRQRLMAYLVTLTQPLAPW